MDKHGWSSQLLLSSQIDHCIMTTFLLIPFTTIAIIVCKCTSAYVCVIFISKSAEKRVILQGRIKWIISEALIIS